MAAEPGATTDRNPATPDSPYATVNETWGGNNPVNPFGDPGASNAETAHLANFSNSITLSQGTDSDIAGQVIPVRPPVSAGENGY